MMTIDRKSLNIVATNAMVLALYVALAKFRAQRHGHLGGP